MIAQCNCYGKISYPRQIPDDTYRGMIFPLIVMPPVKLAKCDIAYIACRKLSKRNPDTSTIAAIYLEMSDRKSCRLLYIKG